MSRDLIYSNSNSAEASADLQLESNDDNIESPPTNIKQGEWVAAVYDDKCYPGVVEAVESGDQVTISFMQKAGKGGKSKWPKKQMFKN